MAGKFAIEIDGVTAGWVQSVEGGTASADVVVEKMGPDLYSRKHIGGPKWEDITITCGTGMTKGFYGWIQDSIQHKYSRRSGAIITADYNFKEVSRMEFKEALISEVGFPALDAGSKDPAKMTLKFSPEVTTNKKGSGPGADIKDTFKQATQKKWLPANFRLKIDGLDVACARVNKIDALVLKQKNIEHAVGEVRAPQKEPASIEMPNLVITVAEAFGDELYKWHEDFVINGNRGDDKEKGGTLEYLTPDLKEVLFTVTFSHLGIFKLTADKVEAGADKIRNLKAEMYCEEMHFEYGGSATFA